MEAQDGSHAEVLPFLVTVADEERDDSMGIFRRHDPEVALSLVPIGTLRDNLLKTAVALQAVFEDVAEAADGRLTLREAQIRIEVSASGGVQLIGTTEVKGTGSITLTFKE